MTGGGGFRLGGTSIDRAGGVLRLFALASTLAERGRPWSLVSEERDRDFVLLVVDGETGEVVDTLIECRIASSAAVREDQLDQLIGDQIELEPIIRAAVERLAIPELEKRALDGDR